MATLKDLADLIARSGISPETVDLIVGEIGKRFGGDKIYIPAPDHSKKDQMLAALRTLPSGVVAERFGVTRSYACRVARKVSKN